MYFITVFIKNQVLKINFNILFKFYLLKKFILLSPMILEVFQICIDRLV